MFARPTNPVLSLGGILLVAISLSIGWGIRGNYGHETGAMLPGALAAIAVCLLSGRADWRERVVYFAFFGAVGWGLGGSISYMQVIGYTHSGHLPTQVYGFAGLFLIGFLWAAFGGGGIALPATLERRKLTAMFVPLAILFIVWMAVDIVVPILSRKLDPFEGAMKRHESALYWLDSDWFSVLVMMVAMLFYDLCERRFGRAWELALAGAIGAWIGCCLHWLLYWVGLSDLVWNLFVRPQGDTTLFPAEQLSTNWPSSLPGVSQHVGWALGLIVGVTIYFGRRGHFAHGSGLIVAMTFGWFVGFLLLPVTLGIRLTPPRGDNWAGMLGAFGGVVYYCRRQSLQPVLFASIVCGIIGGIGFSGIALVKLIAMVPGNPALTTDPAVIAQWRHWQHANWHSFLEQSYGFVNGIGVAIAVGLLVRRVGSLDNTAPRQRWTELAALAFVVPMMIYFNMVKNVADWTSEQAGGFRSLPLVMKSPLFGEFEMSAWGWFHLFYGIAAAAFLALAIVHHFRPISLLPTSWLGRGQLLYFVILWVFVLGNFAKALTSFREQRLLTEGVILLNAVLATMLILVLPRERDTSAETMTTEPVVNFQPLIWRTTWVLVAVVLIAPPAMTYGVRHFYGDHHSGHSGDNYRFGEKANWRTAPLLKGKLHR